MTDRQPVHTMYGGAHLFRADTVARVGASARKALDEYAPDAHTLATAIGLDPARANQIFDRLLVKLRDEPVEDYRIDFEDGYGHRANDEEDRDAVHAATEVARGHREGTLPPFIGIRIKPLTTELTVRAVRTLERFVTTMASDPASTGLPDNFVVTLPKVTDPEQVTVLTETLEILERATGLAAESIAIEVMVESPKLIVDRSGRSLLPALIDAAGGRLRGAHFGPYDYSSACGVMAAHQGIRHESCDFARHMMQVAYAETGVWLSDGPTIVMPTAIHRPTPDHPLTPAQRAENTSKVHGAWRLHYENVRHALVGGFYQGWDLHPAQLVTRYAAVFAFLLEDIAGTGERLRTLVSNAARATLVGNVFDDAATGQGLLNYFLRGLSAGAVTEAEATSRTGLTTEELRAGSFVEILEGRR